MHVTYISHTHTQAHVKSVTSANEVKNLEVKDKR